MDFLENQGSALITGASSGIGAVYADRLARRGCDLVLVARNRERLEALAKRLREETGRSIETVAADLGDKADLAGIEAMLRTESRFSMLVNNAGFGATAPLLASDIDKMEAMIALNVTALTRLTFAAAPGFVARGRGAVINIASIVAIAPELLNGVYGGSKAYVLAFSQSLHHELRRKAWCPGRAAWSHRDRVLGYRRPACREPSADDGDDQRESRRCGARRAGSGRTRHHPVPAEYQRLGRLRKARRALTPNLSRRQPAARYGIVKRSLWSLGASS